MNDFEDANYQPRSVKCDKCQRIFIKNERSDAFAQAVSDRSALRDLVLASAEDVERNLVEKLPVSAIAQMIARNPVDVKELGMGKLCR
jgi:hypothetical protein